MCGWFAIPRCRNRIVLLVSFVFRYWIFVTACCLLQPRESHIPQHLPCSLLQGACPAIATRSPLAPEARRAPLSPAIAPEHTALRSRQRPPPAERRAGLSLSHPALASSQAAHPQPAPGCVAHIHTQRGGGSWRARRYTAARHAFLRGGRTRAFPRDPARPQPTTAPHTTSRDIRPHRVDCTIGPSPLVSSGTAALPTRTRMNHVVQGRPPSPCCA